MMLATTVTTIAGITLSAVAGRWITAAALIAGAAATIGIASSLNNQNDDLKKNALTLAQAKDNYNKSLKDANIPKTVPVEISNKSPISVKGQVEIEKESQKYMFDLAAQRAMAQLNIQYITPQFTIQNQNISKEVDYDEVNQKMGSMIAASAGIQSQGVYQ